jgi:hypothetical protein
VPAELQQRLLREHERWQLGDRQIKALTCEHARRIRTSKDKSVDKVRQLLRLRGIGAVSLVAQDVPAKMQHHRTVAS